jgi:hypothetical protein
MRTATISKDPSAMWTDGENVGILKLDLRRI